MLKKKQIGGFTLIELLVVIAIIALLLSIILPSLKRAKEITRQVICSSQLRQCGVAVKMYSEDNEEYLPDAHYLDAAGNIDMERPNHHSYTVYRDTGATGERYPNGRLKPFRFAYLYEGDYIDTPELFYCPGNNKREAPQYVYESYTKPEPWGSLPQDFNAGGNQWVRIGYTYYPSDAKPRLLGDGVPDDKSLKFTRMNPNIPYTSDVIHGLDSLSHKRHLQKDENDVVVSGLFGLNALYIDGHVSFCNDPSVFWNTVNPVTGNNPWELIEAIAELRDYDEVFFTVYRAIGP